MIQSFLVVISFFYAFLINTNAMEYGERDHQGRTRQIVNLPYPSNEEMDTTAEEMRRWLRGKARLHGIDYLGDEKNETNFSYNPGETFKKIKEQVETWSKKEGLLPKPLSSVFLIKKLLDCYETNTGINFDDALHAIQHSNLFMAHYFMKEQNMEEIKKLHLQGLEDPVQAQTQKPFIDGIKNIASMCKEPIAQDFCCWEIFHSSATFDEKMGEYVVLLEQRNDFAGKYIVDLYRQRLETLVDPSKEEGVWDDLMTWARRVDRPIVSREARLFLLEKCLNIKESTVQVSFKQFLSRELEVEEPQLSFKPWALLEKISEKWQWEEADEALARWWIREAKPKYYTFEQRYKEIEKLAEKCPKVWDCWAEGIEEYVTFFSEVGKKVLQEAPLLENGNDPDSRSQIISQALSPYEKKVSLGKRRPLAQQYTSPQEYMEELYDLVYKKGSPKAVELFAKAFKGIENAALTISFGINNFSLEGRYSQLFSLSIDNGSQVARDFFFSELFKGHLKQKIASDVQKVSSLSEEKNEKIIGQETSRQLNQFCQDLRLGYAFLDALSWAKQYRAGTFFEEYYRNHS